MLNHKPQQIACTLVQGRLHAYPETYTYTRADVHACIHAGHYSVTWNIVGEHAWHKGPRDDTSSKHTHMCARICMFAWCQNAELRAQLQAMKLQQNGASDHTTAHPCNPTVSANGDSFAYVPDRVPDMLYHAFLQE